MAFAIESFLSGVFEAWNCAARRSALTGVGGSMFVMVEPSKSKKKTGMLCLESQRRAASEICPVAFSSTIESYSILRGRKRYFSGVGLVFRPTVILSSACGLGLLVRISTPKPPKCRGFMIHCYLLGIVA